jgi:superfamily II DNA/RNA helicase
VNRIQCYQEMVKRQLEVFEDSKRRGILEYLVFHTGTSSFPGINSSRGYIIKVKSLTDANLQECVNMIDELKKKDLLLEVPLDSGSNAFNVLTTIHGDVVFRVLRGRAFEDDLDKRWVGWFNIELREVYFPDFKAIKVEELADILRNFFQSNGVDENTSNTISKAIVNGLKEAGYKTLAEWQLKAVKEILTGGQKGYVIDSPTATGKTLVFMIAAIAYAVLAKLGKLGKSQGVLLLYPRRTLQKQQTERLLKIVHFINKYLENVKPDAIIDIGIDQGVKTNDSYKDKDYELKYKCPEGDGDLIQRRDDKGNLVVECRGGGGSTRILRYFVGVVYSGDDRYFILSRAPSILISNPWTLRLRIKSLKEDFRKAYINRSLAIFDEAHVYTNVSYLDLVASIHRFFKVNKKEMNREAKVIISSATIYMKDRGAFLKWLTGMNLPPSDIKVLSYEQLEPKKPELRGLQVIVMLLPYRLSIETTVEGLIQVLSLALNQRRLKAIVFVDSISEVSTLKDYLSTIYDRRRGVEVCDHILRFTCRNGNKPISINDIRPFSDDYSWSHLLDTSVTTTVTDTNILLSHIEKIGKIIDIHHGALDFDLRESIESQFVKGNLKILLATSTIDIGVDYDDVTFIVQYKDPRSDETLIQRVGRAGRREDIARIALAFYIPTPLPALFQRIHEKASPIVATKVNLPHESVIMEKEKVEEVEYEIKKEIERACSDEYKLGGEKAYQRIVGVIVNKLMLSKGEALSIFDIEAVRESHKFREEIKKQLSKLNQAIKDIVKRDERLGGHIKTAIKDFVRKIKEFLSEDPIKLMPLSKKSKDEYVDAMCGKIEEIISKDSILEIGINKLSDKIIVKIMGADEDIKKRYKKEEWDKGKLKGLESKLNEVNTILNSMKTTLESACRNRLFVLPSEIHKALGILSKNKQYDACKNIEGAWYYGGLRELFGTLVKYVSGLTPGSEIDSVELSVHES